MPQRNPFTPNFGQVPRYMAGRRQVISEITEAFEDGTGNPDLTGIFVGPRGSGKTATLSLLANEAEQSGWICASVTALPGMLDNIIDQAAMSGAHLLETGKPERRLTGLGILDALEIEWEYAETEPDWRGGRATWRTRLTALVEELNGRDVGLLVTVDEVDPDLPELAELAATYQHFIREERKVALLMAGLPTKVMPLLAGPSTSFLRRAPQHHLGLVSDVDVEEALDLTFRCGGKTIAQDALDAAVRATSGFPFMLQLVGYRSWNASGENPEVSLEDVTKGVLRARGDMKERVFDITYQELSKGDLAFLRAMLEDCGSSALVDIRKRLGNRSPSYVSNYKRRLMAQGLLDEPERGKVRIALPGFREYLESLEGWQGGS